VILILGVTASGKGRLGYELARRTEGEIVSVDSMKVYRRMDIGTAKPSESRQEGIKHHLIDVVEPSESFGVDQFLDLSNRAIEEIGDRGKHVIAVGGTAMYIKAQLYGLFEGPGQDLVIRGRYKDRIEKEGTLPLYERLEQVDPEACRRIHRNDARRIVRALEVFELTGKPISSFQNQWSDRIRDNWKVIGIRRPREVESHRINLRVKRMIEEGLVEEVEGLLGEEKPLSRQARVAIGYAEMIDHLEGRMSLDEAVEKIKINTRKLAKSQRTWFKTFREVDWIDVEEENSFDKVIDTAMAKYFPGRL